MTKEPCFIGFLRRRRSDVTRTRRLEVSHNATHVRSGFSFGTVRYHFADDQAEVFGTTLVGTRSLSFHATLKKLAD